MHENFTFVSVDKFNMRLKEVLETGIMILSYVIHGKRIIMSRSYNKLWHILIDRNMSRSDLRRKAGITTNALAKLGKNESVPLETLEKICVVLDCGLDDIVEHFPDEEQELISASESNEG